MLYVESVVRILQLENVLAAKVQSIKELKQELTERDATILQLTGLFIFH